MTDTFQVSSYDEQFKLELGPKTQTVLIAHPNSLAKMAIYLDVAEVTQSNVPPSVTTLVTEAFDNSIASDVGGAVYKRTTEAETLSNVSSASMQSLDGAYWILSKNQDMSPTLFGAYPHNSFDEMTHDDAVDSTQQINDCRSFALKNKKPVFVDYFFKYNGTLSPNEGESFVGNGRHNCGFQIWNNNTETGLQILSDNVIVTKLGIESYLYEAKIPGGGTGMIGVPIITGNFNGGMIPTPKGFIIDDVLLGRKDNETGHTSYSGVAAQFSGGSKNGYIGVIEIADRHSFALMSHWTGNNVETHGAHTESVHPREFDIEKVIVTADITSLLTLSSVANIRIGSVIAESARSVFTLLPGDDTDVNNVGQPGIGSGVYIDELVCHDVTTNGKTGTNDDAFSVSSQGTSKFRTEEAESLILEQMRYDVHVRSLVMHCNSPDEILYGIDLFNFYGNFKVDAAYLTGFTGDGGAGVRVRQSRGDINIHIAHTDSPIILDDTEANITGSSNIKDPAGQNPDSVSDSFNIKVLGDYWGKTANNISRGNTQILMSEPLSRDVLRGHTLRVTGTVNGSVQTMRVKVDDFTNNGLFQINLQKPFPHDMTDVTVSSDPRDVVVNIDAKLTGARTGILVENGKVNIKGEVQGGRFNVYASGLYTDIDYHIQTPVLGDSRTLTENYTVYDAWLEEGVVIKLTGDVGKGLLVDTGNYFSIGAPIPNGDPYVLPKVFLRNSIIYDKDHVMIPNENVELFVDSCRTVEGQEYTYFDAVLGVKKTGENVNGHWQYHDDGVLECWHRSFPAANTGNSVWTYPQQFHDVVQSVPIASVVGNSDQTARTYGSTGTSCIVTLREAGALTSGNVNLYAKGRWRDPDT